ncbi:MAG: hypothetical protein ACTSRZ_10060 [Promethearchaeota archaeon]
MNPVQVIRDRFGIHRGLESPYAPPNSLKAIKSAIDLNPVFIEFDVIYFEGRAVTAHPPQKPLDDLREVMALFKGKTTFPKLDLKFDDKTYKKLTKIVVEILKDFDSYALVNLSGVKGRYKIFEVEEYFVNQIKDLPFVRINIDFARFRKIKNDFHEAIDKETEQHLKKIKDYIDAVSLEIYEEDWDYIIKMGLRFEIHNYYFWLRGWPDVKHPVIHIDVIKKAIELEKKHNINVYFDINTNYIEDLNKIIILYDNEGKNSEKLPFLYYG